MELAKQLPSSFGNISGAEIEQLWLREAARRAVELDQWLTKRVSSDEVSRQAQALLN